jgi:hypothetical protein
MTFGPGKPLLADVWGTPLFFGGVPENKGETLGTVHTVRFLPPCSAAPVPPYRFVGKTQMGQGLASDLADTTFRLVFA